MQPNHNLGRSKPNPAKIEPGNPIMPVKSQIEVVIGYPEIVSKSVDIYFSADVETDGPIPGPYSMLSFAFVYAGAYDGKTFFRPPSYEKNFYVELQPISENFENDALNINGLNRDWLTKHGKDPYVAMTEAANWIAEASSVGSPVIAAYPLGFDWSWLYWYFIQYSKTGSPFGYSRAFDIKTAISIKLGRMISNSGRSRIPEAVRSLKKHTHHALDDALEQAEIFANVFVMDAGNE